MAITNTNDPLVFRSWMGGASWVDCCAGPQWAGTYAGRRGSTNRSNHEFTQALSMQLWIKQDAALRCGAALPNCWTPFALGVVGLPSPFAVCRRAYRPACWSAVAASAPLVDPSGPGLGTAGLLLQQPAEDISHMELSCATM